VTRLEGKLKDPNIVRKIWGRYLHDEQKYDAWGAQGKLLVIEEVLMEEGLAREELSGAYTELERFLNMVFPRTFSSTRRVVRTMRLAKAIRKYYRYVRSLISKQNVDEQRLQCVSVEETAGKFNMPTEQVREIIGIA